MEGLRSQGADLVASGVRYRTWSKHEHASVLVLDENGAPRRTIQLDAEGNGYSSALDPEGAAGDLYQIRFGDSQGWPDPASRFQPEGVHGPSMVVDPQAYAWGDRDFVAPAFSDLVIYELHVGTFSPAGTFRSAIPLLDHVVRLGATAIELMPVADFPGTRNWGYDGVALYAPAHAYGHPDDLRALVDAAHARHLAVILDVVYNHLGPDGNYLSVFHDAYFDEKEHTPWGAALNFAEPAVRSFFAENALYWRREFHIDGFRLDATHAINDASEPHILAEISARVRSSGGFLVAEDERNEPRLLRAPRDGGYGLDGVWSDDFHHSLRVRLTNLREGYYHHFHGTAEELAETLEHGWLFRGQLPHAQGHRRGAACVDFPPEKFVYCISNHDQVGNRALGERLGQIIAPAAYRAASALLCLVPYTPMLFMGQEWNASTPFQFFTEHNDELGRLVTQGRRKEFQGFAAFRDPQLREAIPDPQAAETFANSKLRWEEVEQPEHLPFFELYRAFLDLRKNHPAFRARARESWKITVLDDGMLALLRGLGTNSPCLVLIDLIGGHEMPDMAAVARRVGAPAERWEPLLSSNDARFGGEQLPAFAKPATIVFAPAAA